MVVKSLNGNNYTAYMDGLMLASKVKAIKIAVAILGVVQYGSTP
jgi:hypothetical protein